MTGVQTCALPIYDESVSKNKIVKVAKVNQNLSKKTKVASLTN